MTEPWHEEAKKLHAAGVGTFTISRQLGQHHHRVKRLLVPEQLREERRRAYVAARDRLQEIRYAHAHL